MSYLICIKHNGKSYCWNSETEQIEEITRVETVELSECPEPVLKAIVKMQAGRMIVVVDKEKEE